MNDLPQRYRYKYKMWPQFGFVYHTYELVGAKGGLHFHVTEHGPDHPDMEHGCGLEIHYRVPPEYMADKPPSHDECQVIKCPCWHDGTSMYAREHILPHFTGVTHERMFELLAAEADRRFSEDDTP